MKVVLFCGGQGTRIRESSNGLPKPLVTIGGRPILWHIMKYYAHFGHKDFILCLGYKGDEIKRFFLNYDPCLSADFTLSNGEKKIHKDDGDISDWKITFAETGQKSNIGQRFKAVEKYLAGDDIFLANYADALSDVNLNELIGRFEASKKIGCFLCVKPSQTFHVVTLSDVNTVKDVKHVRDTGIVINGGYFVFRKTIFSYIKEGEDLVNEPFSRLIKESQLMGFRYEQFWYCMDTFREHLELNDMHANGSAPWEVWK